jgi:hypothetical protein
MAAILARAAVSAAVGSTIPVINNIFYLVTTVKTLTASQDMKDIIDDLDIEATVSTIELVCTQHKTGRQEFLLAREYVEKALKAVKFDLETIHVITKLHREGWISRWRTLNMGKDKRRLARSMHILRSRFNLMWTIANGIKVPCVDPSDVL